MKISFQEKQRFTQWWIWILIGGISLIPIVGIYQQIIKGEPFGSKPMPDLGLIIFLLLMIALVVFFRTMYLKTEIDEDAIRIKFFPFVTKDYHWKDIATAEVVNYGFVGGWGIRLGTKYGTVYNVKGNQGLAIRLKNGKKNCIGTQKKDELEAVIAEARRQQKLELDNG